MSVLVDELGRTDVDPRKVAAREFEAQLPDCSRLAFRVAFGVLHRREAAEDVAQEAALRAFQNFGRLRNRERLQAWVVRVAWRLALDEQRAAARRERRERLEMAAADLRPQATAEGLAASGEFERALFAAMDELSERLRVVLVLAGVEGYDTAEIASLLRLPEGTVKSRLHSARKKLAERLRWIARDTKAG